MKYIKELLPIFIYIACFGGYIANIVKLAGADGFTGIELVRMIGCFIFPVGIVMGYIS